MTVGDAFIDFTVFWRLLLFLRIRNRKHNAQQPSQPDPRMHRQIFTKPNVKCEPHNDMLHGYAISSEALLRHYNLVFIEFVRCASALCNMSK